MTLEELSHTFTQYALSDKFNGDELRGALSVTTMAADQILNNVFLLNNKPTAITEYLAYYEKKASAEDHKNVVASFVAGLKLLSTLTVALTTAVKELKAISLLEHPELELPRLTEYAMTSTMSTPECLHHFEYKIDTISALVRCLYATNKVQLVTLRNPRVTPEQHSNIVITAMGSLTQIITNLLSFIDNVTDIWKKKAEVK